MTSVPASASSMRQLPMMRTIWAGLSQFFEDIYSEAEITENQTALLTARMQQAASGMHGAAKELIQTLADPMHHLLMAQRNNVQNWDAVAKLLAQMQQAAATKAQECDRGQPIHAHKLTRFCPSDMSI